MWNKIPVLKFKTALPWLLLSILRQLIEPHHTIFLPPGIVHASDSALSVDHVYVRSASIALARCPA